MTSSCLFKLSLLVMEELQSLEADKKCTNFPCQFLFLPQERWKIRLLATFVSVQCLTEDSSQRENPKVSFLLGESLRLLLSQNWLLNFAPCRWRTAREDLKCPRCTSWAHNRYLRGSSAVVFFLRIKRTAIPGQTATSQGLQERENANNLQPRKHLQRAKGFS